MLDSGNPMVPYNDAYAMKIMTNLMCGEKAWTRFPCYLLMTSMMGKISKPYDDVSLDSSEGVCLLSISSIYLYRYLSFARIQ